MTPTIAAIVALVLALIGVTGIIVPVLPGSITVLVGLVVWAVFGGSTQAVTLAVIGGVAVLAGMLASSVLTTRRLGARNIPTWPIVVGAVCGLVAGFWVPVVGLPLGFIAGLLVCEFVRVRDARQAWSTSMVALQAVGIGMLVELGLAMFASTLLALSVAWTFLG